MTRNRASAKKAGASFEQLAAAFLQDRLDDDRIERRVMGGVNDKGDISGVRFMGHRVVIECKNVAQMSLGAWVEEARVEAGNDGALLGVVVHKRRGKGTAAHQFVTLTLEDFTTLLMGGVTDD
jgi:hypothetical protein